MMPGPDEIAKFGQSMCPLRIVRETHLGEDGAAERGGAPPVAAEEQAQVEQPLGPREGDEQLVDHHRGRAEGHDGRVLHTHTGEESMLVEYEVA